MYVYCYNRVVHICKRLLRARRKKPYEKKRTINIIYVIRGVPLIYVSHSDDVCTSYLLQFTTAAISIRELCKKKKQNETKQKCKSLQQVH